MPQNNIILNQEQIDNFKKDGHIVIKNFMRHDEINKLLKSFEESKKAHQEKKVYNVIDDERIWEFLCNKKLKEVLTAIIGPEVYYLHDVSLLYGEINQKTTWHRDNPCRRTGIGPDWKEEPRYNVVSAALYFSDSDTANAGLNMIPGSHFKKYKSSISNLIRIIHSKTRNNKKLRFLRNIFEKIIGHEIRYKPGDLVIFYCSLYHTGSVILKNKHGNSYREGIITRFGGSGMHAKTFMNYELNYRKKSLMLAASKKKFFFIN